MNPAPQADAFAPPESLYIHVPFCRARCRYCDFRSRAADPAVGGLGEAIVAATVARARVLANRFGASSFRTVYVGGGTPTVLGPRLLDLLLRGLGDLAAEPVEWTVEANPESLGAETLAVIAGSGATRASIGVQSLDEGGLSILGRLHDASRALAAVEDSARTGLDVSADLIAALPRARGGGVSARDLRDEARRLLEAGASHLSIYDLCVEEGTPIAGAIASGELVPLSEDEAWEERREVEEFLAGKGFLRYEIPNYAPAGRECAHNITYWRMESYVGAGPGAVSTIALRPPGRIALAGRDGGSLRIEEPFDLEAYAVQRPPPAEETRLGVPEAAFETIMMGFRSAFGLDQDAFRLRFGLDLVELVPSTLKAWASRLVPGRSLPASAGRGRGNGQALDGEGMDLLNRFLGGCLSEMEGAAVFRDNGDSRPA